MREKTHEKTPDTGTGELRPERLGDSFRLRPERLGLESGAAGKGVHGQGGWTFDADGTTMGQIFRFAGPAEMREFVADLQGVLATLETRRSSADREGPVSLILFLAGHRIEGGGG